MVDGEGGTHPLAVASLAVARVVPAAVPAVAVVIAVIVVVAVPIVPVVIVLALRRRAVRVMLIKRRRRLGNLPRLKRAVLGLRTENMSKEKTGERRFAPRDAAGQPGQTWAAGTASHAAAAARRAAA